MNRSSVVTRAAAALLVTTTMSARLPTARTPPIAMAQADGAAPGRILKYRHHLPAVFHAPASPPAAPTSPPAPTGCPLLPTPSFASLPLSGPPLHALGDAHPDLDLAMRGWVQVVPESVVGGAGLVDYAGATDGKAPQLSGLAPAQFAPARLTFSGLYRVHDWDWTTNRRGGPLTVWPVSLVAVTVPAGQALHVPDSGYEIGQGFEVLVIHAADGRVTLSYTRSDNVARGYVLHVTGVCVEPRLLALYGHLNAAGRARLPALRAGDAFGTAADAVRVAIRDTGTFMDPRSRKDWWRGH
ncbi:MAG: hypothetical protein IPG72_03145 [Ardenticatenales bacterium]|jgi:hypothetical protein|nr:hypothetical protein [Ardenticatenales bacterium]